MRINPISAQRGHGLQPKNKKEVGFGVYLKPDQEVKILKAVGQQYPHVVNFMKECEEIGFMLLPGNKVKGVLIEEKIEKGLLDKFKRLDGNYYKDPDEAMVMDQLNNLEENPSLTYLYQAVNEIKNKTSVSSTSKVADAEPYATSEATKNNTIYGQFNMP